MAEEPAKDPDHGYSVAQFWILVAAVLAAEMINEFILWEQVLWIRLVAKVLIVVGVFIGSVTVLRWRRRNGGG